MQQAAKKKEGRTVNYNEGKVTKATAPSGYTLTKQVSMRSQTKITSSFMSSRTSMHAKNSGSRGAAIEFRDIMCLITRGVSGSACKGLPTE